MATIFVTMTGAQTSLLIFKKPNQTTGK